MPATFDLILKNGKCFIDNQLKTIDIGISEGIIKSIGKIDWKKSFSFVRERKMGTM